MNKILESSLKLFAEHGYDATSISQIAEHAGVSKGLIYNYFDSKLDLLKGMIGSLNKGEERMMEDVIDDDPTIMMENIFRVFFKEVRENTETWKMIFSVSMQVEKYEFVQEMTVNRLKQFTNLFTELLTRMNFPNPEQEARVISGLFDGLGFHYLVVGKDYPIEEMEEFLIEKYCKS